MDDPAYTHRLDPAWMRELRHLAGVGGWVHAEYLDRREQRPIRDDLIAAGHIEPGIRGSAATYELTSAGRAWCRENGAA